MNSRSLETYLLIFKWWDYWINILAHTKKKKAKETVCSRNVILMKILQQFTFMNKEGINKKLSVKTKIFIKKKRNITDIKNAWCVVSSLLQWTEKRPIPRNRRWKGTRVLIS